MKLLDKTYSELEALEKIEPFDSNIHKMISANSSKKDIEFLLSLELPRYMMVEQNDSYKIRKVVHISKSGVSHFVYPLFGIEGTDYVFSAKSCGELTKPIKDYQEIPKKPILTYLKERITYVYFLYVLMLWSSLWF